MRTKFNLIITFTGMLIVFVMFQNCGQTKNESKTMSSMDSGKEFTCDEVDSSAVKQSKTIRNLNNVGTKKYAILLVNFTDDLSEPISVADANNTYFKTVEDYYRENSYGQLDVQVDVYGYFTISTCAEMYESNGTVLAMAAARGIDLSQYDEVSSMYTRVGNNNRCNNQNIESHFGYFTDPLAVAAHEMGHAFGIGHAEALKCLEGPIGPQCVHAGSYTDNMSIMGNGYGHFTALEKEIFGWMNSSNMTTVSSGGNYQLTPYESQVAGPKVLKVLKSTNPVTGDRQWYYLEYHQPIGFGIKDPRVPRRSDFHDGVIFRIFNEYEILYGYRDFGDVALLMDMNPDTKLNQGLEVGKSYLDKGMGAKFTVVSADSNGAVINIDYNNPKDTQGPSAPVVTKKSLACNKHSLSWPASTDASGILGYRVYQGGYFQYAEGPQVDNYFVASVTAGATNTYEVAAVDLHGQETKSAPISITGVSCGTADTTLPSISISSPAANSVNSGMVTFTPVVSDNVAVERVVLYFGIYQVGSSATAPFAITLDTTKLPNGASQSFSMQAMDTSGNKSSKAIVNIALNNPGRDFEPPTITTTMFNQNQWLEPGMFARGNMTIYTSASDQNMGSLGGIKKVDFFVDGNLISSDTVSPFELTNYDSTQLSNGTHVFSAKATDLSDNVSNAYITPVNVSNGVTGSDATAPIVAMRFPQIQNTVSGNVTFEVTATDNVGIAKVELYIDDVLKSTRVSAPYSYYFNSAVYPNGDHTFSAKAYDAAGNVSTVSQKNKFQNATAPSDTTAPTVSLTYPASGNVISGTVSMTATASDNVAMNQVQFFVDGVQVGSDSSSPYSFSLDTTTLSNAMHTFAAKAIDTSSNQSSMSQVSATVNNVASYTYSWVVGSWSACSVTACGSNGTQTRSVVCTRNDNVAVADSFCTTSKPAISQPCSTAPCPPAQDTIAPVVSITSPTYGAIVPANASLSINATASDNVGVTKVEFSVNGVLICTDSSAPYSCSYSVPKGNGKNYQIGARAFDAAGNSNTNIVVVTSGSGGKPSRK